MGCGGGGGGGTTVVGPPVTGNLEIGFTNLNDANTDTTPVSGYKSILLNVVGVRLNPSTDPNVSELDSGWVSIAAPAGVATKAQVTTSTVSGGPFFGVGVVSTGTSGTPTSEIQVDLNALQLQTRLLNTGAIPPNTYHQIELLLDSQNPGNVLPTCAQSASGAEGCINYHVTLLHPTTSIRTTDVVTVGEGGLATLVLNVSLSEPPVPPGSSSGTYTIDPVISVAPNSMMGLLQGSVTGATLSSETVTAELAGTDTIIARAQVLSGGSYSMSLPAGVDGTAYDLYASGSGTSIDAVSGVTITRGTTTTQGFTVSSKTTKSITGQILDACATSQPIQGATLILYLPGDGTSVTCTALPTPAGCVAVASASTDDTGVYPLPGQNGAPAAFSAVPLGDYSLKISASGFDTITSAVTVPSGTVQCTGSTSTTNCSYNLNSAEISGTVSLGATASSTVDVMVMAEDSGTSNVENFTTATIPSGASSAPFTVRVPSQSQVSSFDLFAWAEDYFNGVQQLKSGHAIAVLADVAGASACQTSSTSPDLESMSCVGHGSISGSASTFDPNTTIEVSKEDPNSKFVQLMSSEVPQSGNSAGAFSFCAPADTYQLRRFESATPAATPTNVTLQTPTAIPTPCSSICSVSSTSCLLCVNTSGAVVQ
jgi:hypothetical protein